MSQAIKHAIGLALALVFLEIVAGSRIALRLLAQETPIHPGTVSILESSTEEVNETLPEPTPPQEPITDSIPEPPSDDSLTVEPVLNPTSDEKVDDPFANLFKDLVESAESKPPSAPGELERITAGAGDTLPESLPRLKSDELNFRSLPTERGYALVLAAPVHEALLFNAGASSHETDPMVVPNAPPATVKEQAPLAKRSPTGSSVPQFVGNNVQWIGGYWAWLNDARKYVWVSGLYRDIPPGRQWKSGSWSKTVAGYQWITGYWAEANVQNSDAGNPLAPPATRESDVSSTPPDDDSFWIAGQWVAEQAQGEAANAKAERESGYQWQPGFWSKRSKEWIWQPSRYIDSPSGYVYVSGYWDYEPHYRGQPYATVEFDGQESASTDIAYQPLYPLSRPAALLLHLFTKSNSHHVFYGDLYDRTYADLGYHPWYEIPIGATADQMHLDPILSFYQWKYRSQGVDFANSMVRFADHFRSAPSVRPATQLETDPRLADREGLAGQVNAKSFDEIVRGNVGLRSVVMLPGFEQQSGVASSSGISSSGNATSANNTTSANDTENNSSAVTTASAFIPLQSNRVGTTANTAGTAPQPVIALNPGFGASQLMVMPGGRVLVVPAMGGPFGPPVPFGMSMPSPPIPPIGFGPRFRRR